MPRISQTPLMLPATYRASPFIELVGNPLAEALPHFPHSDEDAFLTLARPIHFSVNEREAAEIVRLFAVNRLGTLLEPLASHHEIFQDLYLHILNGYQHRPIHSESFRRSVVQSYRSAVTIKMQDLAPATPPTADGMTIVGISGVGKSNLIERSLSLLPKAIYHDRWGIRQVVSIKIDCPSGGSLKSLIMSAIKQVDTLVGTSWGKACERMTGDDLIVAANAVFQSHFVGVLVIDEIQNLARSRDGADRVLEYLVNLANGVKVPLVFVGTPAALPLFEHSFAQARRSGPSHELKPIPFGGQWENFAAGLWRYQWVKAPRELTPGILRCWHELTFGIQALAVQLFRLCQRVAIRTGTETVSEPELQAAAQRYMRSVTPAVRALNAGATKTLAQFDDLIRQTVSECRQAN